MAISFLTLLLSDFSDILIHWTIRPTYPLAWKLFSVGTWTLFTPLPAWCSAPHTLLHCGPKTERMKARCPLTKWTIHISGYNALLLVNKPWSVGEHFQRFGYVLEEWVSGPAAIVPSVIVESLSEAPLWCYSCHEGTQHHYLKTVETGGCWSL